MIDNHADMAVARLRDQFRAESNDVRKIAEIVGSRAQGVESALWAVREAVRDPSAQGRSVAGPDETQVRLGKVLGAIPWGGESTSEYETWMRAQIHVNASNGTIEDLLAIQTYGGFGTSVAALADSNDTAASVWGTLSGVGCCILEASSTSLRLPMADYNRVLHLLRQGAPAGVRVLMGAWVEDPSTAVFVLDSSPLDDASIVLYTMLDTPSR